jgi:hypothetical protein
MTMECSAHYATVLKKNPGFDFLNNVRFDKDSIIGLQAALEYFYVPFFDCHHIIPLKLRKREEMRYLLAAHKSENLMFANKTQNRVFAFINRGDAERFQLLNDCGRD